MARLAALHRITTHGTFATLRNLGEGGVANGSGHEYDVFVSYAHADNEKPLGSAAEYGWVTTLGPQSEYRSQ